MQQRKRNKNNSSSVFFSEVCTCSCCMWWGWMSLQLLLTWISHKMLLKAIGIKTQVSDLDFYDSDLYLHHRKIHLQSSVECTQINHTLSAPNIGNWLISTMQNFVGSFYTVQFKWSRRKKKTSWALYDFLMMLVWSFQLVSNNSYE